MSSAATRDATGRSDARATSVPTATRRRGHADRAEQRDAFERGAASPRRGVAEQVVVDEHAVDPGGCSAATATATAPRGSSVNDGSARPSFTGEVAGERGRADDAGALTERGGTIGTSGRYGAPSRCAAEGVAERREEQVAELDEPAGDDDHLGVEDVGEPGEPERDPAGVRLEDAPAPSASPADAASATSTLVTARRSPPARASTFGASPAAAAGAGERTEGGARTRPTPSGPTRRTRTPGRSGRTASGRPRRRSRARRGGSARR